MKLTIETEKEEDGRWIAEVMELSGAMAYGSTQTEAVARAQALALQVLDDRLEAGEIEAKAFSDAEDSSNDRVEMMPNLTHYFFGP